MNLPTEVVTQAVTVRPGDTLVLRIANPQFTRADADRWRDEIDKLAPGVKALFMVGVEQMLVYRPDESKAVT
jgi:hypothetical protein